MDNPKSRVCCVNALMMPGWSVLARRDVKNKAPGSLSFLAETQPETQV